MPLRFNKRESFLCSEPASETSPNIVACPEAFPESGPKMSETEIQQLVEMVGGPDLPVMLYINMQKYAGSDGFSSACCLATI